MSGTTDDNSPSGPDTGNSGRSTSDSADIFGPLPNRRESVHQRVGPFVVTVSFHPNGYPCEVFISQRAKSGTELDDLLYELGVTISKIMQGE